MVNGNEKYLQELYDHVETIQNGWEVEEHLRKLSESRQRHSKLNHIQKVTSL